MATKTSKTGTREDGTVSTRKADIIERIRAILAECTLLDPAERVAIVNALRKEVRKISLFDDPVDMVRWVPADKVEGNTYNPNKVAPPEMRLLEVSIENDGFTQPIVTFHDKEQDRYIVVDGFHRFLVGTKNKHVRERMHGHLPVVVIEKPLESRMASTIRHNRARGKHEVVPMSHIVAILAQIGWEDEQIAKELGMEPDEMLRLKQRTGIAELFKNREFSKSWIGKTGKEDDTSEKDET